MFVSSDESVCGADWHAAVAAALSEGRLALALQPVMQARGAGRVAFHEGLVRLIGRDGTAVPAAAFLPAVEALPLGRLIDRHVLDLALARLRATPDLRLAVNLSALSVADPGWEAALTAALRHDATLAERLIVEITETAVSADSDALADFVRRWQARGVAFAIDDFGAGYTALRHLRRVRFDIIKIDGTFTRGVERDRDNQALVSAMTGIARHFEAMVVAEAVETEAEAAALSDRGIDALQGYLYGRPRLPAAAPALSA